MFEVQVGNFPASHVKLCDTLLFIGTPRGDPGIVQAEPSQSNVDSYKAAASSKFLRYILKSVTTDSLKSHLQVCRGLGLAKSLLGLGALNGPEPYGPKSKATDNKSH